MLPQPLPWCDPLALATSLDSCPMVLLHSSARTSYSGRRSLLAARLVESVDITDLRELNPLLRHDTACFAHGWFGYLGYELRHGCETYSPAVPGRFQFPAGRLMRFEDIYVFDHDERSLTLWSLRAGNLPELRPIPDTLPPAVTELTSHNSRASYEAKVREVLEAIHAGSLYQANLTRKFYGTWETAPNGLALFARMCALTPAPYSAYLRMEDAEILSSSPELFLKVNADGTVCTRPIKGSAPRGTTAAEDESIRSALAHSRKNRAENLMITDLMRNDLARACVDGSVETSGLFDVTKHATIFHMASTVSGQLKPGMSVGDLLLRTFPPGSMTGAPKICAVELCNALEQVERGIYSGAIGWFGGDGSAELSVVIRTLVMQGKSFEFQVGGGIVADSTPESEWRETMDKALGILRTLNLAPSLLEGL